MKKYSGYFFYFLFWLLYFATAKIIFLLYHFSPSSTLTFTETAKVFYYGLRMDISFTGYICILPFFLFLLQSIFTSLSIHKIIAAYTYSLLVIISFLCVADLELYSAWGFRMDTTPLQYFKTPREMAATVSSSPMFLLLLIFLIFGGTFIFLYNRIFSRYMHRNLKRIYFLEIGLSAFLIALLFIPIRGGIQKIPMNISDVYFSEKLFADHAAINLPWNIMFSILNKGKGSNPFDYFSKKKAATLVDSLYETGPVRAPAILSVDKPNIIIIILESFTAKWVESLGGVSGVTPHLDQIAKNGLLFTNIYAAGDRSEKGQIAILSAYPNQAITSIIKTPTKTMGLPSLTQELEKEGYRTSFTYGGELEFANIKSYLLNTGFDKLIDKYAFPLDKRTTSWGVHDQYVFKRFYKNLQTKKEPFFATLYTLSSHEPYDVPLSHFNGKDETSQFKNSIFYTDSVLGKFIEKSKLEPWWPNTLIVIVADHGHPLPGHDANSAPSKFHIPLVFTGGALQMKGIVNTIGSQTDIIPTILNQLELPSSHFPWGKNLLDSAANQFAFYSFNNGFGFVTPEGTVTIDNVSKNIIHISPGFDSADIKFAKAYMQASFQDYLNR